MAYYMNIKSVKTEVAYNNSMQQNVIIEVGCKYIFNVTKPTNKKDRKNNGRVVEILGFSEKFMGEVIVRYMDNGRRGRLVSNHLIPYEGAINNK